MMRFSRVMFSITRLGVNNVGKGLYYVRITEYRNDMNSFHGKNKIKNSITLQRNKYARIFGWNFYG